nr:hypothetical protein [uncultured Cohaesibacter sp.]
MSLLITILRAVAVVSILVALSIYLEFWNVAEIITAAEGHSEGIMQVMVIAAVFMFIGAAYIEEKILKRKTR